MKRITLEMWTLDVEVEKTLYFKGTKLEVCDCLYCRNFAAVISQDHPLLRAKLLELGIDAATPNHVSYFDREDGGQLAIGNYHFSGTVVEGPLSTMEDWNESNTVEIEGMQIGFSKSLELLPDDFPEPVVQVNFEFIMPWVLDERPEGE